MVGLNMMVFQASEVGGTQRESLVLLLASQTSAACPSALSFTFIISTVSSQQGKINRNKHISTSCLHYVNFTNTAPTLFVVTYSECMVSFCTVAQSLKMFAILQLCFPRVYTVNSAH